MGSFNDSPLSWVVVVVAIVFSLSLCALSRATGSVLHCRFHFEKLTQRLLSSELTPAIEDPPVGRSLSSGHPAPEQRGGLVDSRLLVWGRFSCV
jgi:hypothetical protein